MAKINEYIRSLPGVGKRKIEDIISNTRGSGSASVYMTTDDIDTTGISEYSLITDTRLNNVLTQITNRNKAAWFTVKNVESYVNSIEERVDSVISGSSSNLTKARAVLDGIFLSTARKESIDSVHVESFSNEQNTDTNASDCLIANGVLELPIESSTDIAGSWSLKWTNIPSSTHFIDRSTGRMLLTATTPSGSSETSFKATLLNTLSSPSVATNLNINISTGEIKEIRIINSSGVSTPVSVDKRILMNEMVSVSFPRMSVSAIEIDLEQPHYNIFNSNSSVISIPLESESERSLQNSLLGSSSNLSGMVDSAHLASIVATTDAVKTEWSSEIKDSELYSVLSQRQEAIWSRVNSDKKGLLYVISVSSIRIKDVLRKSSGQWISTPIIFNGDVRKMSLSVTKTDEQNANDTWYFSIEGKPWVPVVPENQRYITGEVLSLDFSGLGLLKYPASPDLDIVIHNIPEDSTVTLMTDSQSGNIIGIRISDRDNGDVTVDYTTAYSGIVNLDEIGLSSGDIKIMSAMQNGKLGEHKSFVEDKMTLTRSPYGPIEVYVDGYLATELDMGSSFSDPSLDTNIQYYRVVGRTVVFNGNQKNVSVYYQYAQTSIRIKASLESSMASSGVTPRIDAVMVGLKSMSI